MGIKKIKPQSKIFEIPEGLQELPTPLLFFQESTQTLWANPSFEREFGAVDPQRFTPRHRLHLIQEKPVTLSILTQPGRHEGLILINPQGKKIPVELRVSHFGDASKKCFICQIQDTTPKVELEKQLIQNHLELTQAFQTLKETQSALIQSAKLASLGELSSGIAHELNQPLQAILGFSQELEHLEKLSPTGKEFIQDIISAGKKMAAIIRSLRNFAREAGENLEPISLEHSIHETTKLTHHTLLQKGIQVRTQMTSPIQSVLGNSIQMEQVLVNLINNAADAIESTGRKDGLIEIGLSQKGPQVQLSVSDNGCGMTPSIQQKIFDPFFTTKEVGKGTGLGLSISFGILKQFQAETTVESTPGQGTRFKIRFNTLLNSSQLKKGETR